jgi:hypothetical protein
MAVSPTSFVKQPYEEFGIEVKFDSRLVEGEVISGITVIGLNASEEDVTSDIIVGSEISSEGKSVLIGVKGGEDSKNYKIVVRVQTNMSIPGSSYAKYEADVTMVVKEL